MGCITLCSAFVPFQLNPVYPRISPFSIEYLSLICGFILLTGIVGAAFFKAGKPYLKLKIWLFISFALCWGALFAPVSGITEIGTIDYCDRYNYLPSIVTWVKLATKHHQWRLSDEMGVRIFNFFKRK